MSSEFESFDQVTESEATPQEQAAASQEQDDSGTTAHLDIPSNEYSSSSDAAPSDAPRDSSDEPADSPPATTMVFPQVSAPDEAADTQDQPLPPPSLLDVGATFVDWLRGRLHALGSFAGTHKLAIALVALCVAGAAAGLAYWTIDSSRMPSDEQVSVDASSRLAAPNYTAGEFAVDDPLVLTGVEIGQKSASNTRRDACTVDVVANFANAGMETRADARLTYVREGDGWTCTAASIESASHRATAGVDRQKVADQAAKLLAAADHDDSPESLSSLYHNASVEVTGGEFDEEEQVDIVELHCASTGSFVRYECDLIAHFRFAAASGAWELAGVTVSDGARDLSLQPLVGTWQGSFERQDSTGAKCLAAREQGLVVTVTEASLVDGGDAVIRGTVSGVAHLHAEPARDADTLDGDVILQDTAFTGRLSEGEVDLDAIDLLAGNNPKRDEAGLVFTCTTPDVADGQVTLTLTFGQASAPDAATATLTSVYAYEDMFLMLIPYPREARYVDHFALAKAG